jgi:uncharacterized protein YtpQ (UPF0354 family)
MSRAKSFLGLAFCWVAATAVAADVLSPEDFTQRCAAQIQAAVPRSRVVIEKPLQLELRHPDTGESTIFLEETYETYKMAPEKLDEIVQKHVASVLEAAPDAVIDATRIIPVVKPRSWLAEIGAAEGAPAPVLYDELNEELIVVYAEDAPQSISYFSPTDFSRTGIDRQNLRRLAGDNLMRLIPKIERRGEDGVYMVKAGGDLEASFLAIRSGWSHDSFDVKGDFVFAVPSRGVLYVTGSEDEAGLETVRDYARTGYRDAAQKISPKLFVLRGDKLDVLPE